MRALLMAELTFREALRRRALLAAFLLGLAYLAFFAVGFAFLRQKALEASMPRSFYDMLAGILLVAGLFAVYLLAGLLAIVTAAGTISGEAEAGTLSTIVAKPIHRWEVVLGKWLGHGAMLCLYQSAMAFAILGIVYALSGYFPPRAPLGVLAIDLGIVALLSLSVWSSSCLSAMAAGVVAFALWALALVGSFIDFVGSLANSQALQNVGLVASLLMPNQAMWRLASDAFQPPGLGVLGRANPTLMFGPHPQAWTWWYAALYSAVLVLAAAAIFQRKDL